MGNGRIGRMSQRGRRKQNRAKRRPACGLLASWRLLGSYERLEAEREYILCGVAAGAALLPCPYLSGRGVGGVGFLIVEAKGHVDLHEGKRGERSVTEPWAKGLGPRARRIVGSVRSLGFLRSERIASPLQVSQSSSDFLWRPRIRAAILARLDDAQKKALAAEELWPAVAVEQRPADPDGHGRARRLANDRPLSRLRCEPLGERQAVRAAGGSPVRSIGCDAGVRGMRVVG